MRAEARDGNTGQRRAVHGIFRRVAKEQRARGYLEAAREAERAARKVAAIEADQRAEGDTP